MDIPSKVVILKLTSLSRSATLLERVLNEQADNMCTTLATFRYLRFLAKHLSELIKSSGTEYVALI